MVMTIEGFSISFCICFVSPFIKTERERERVGMLNMFIVAAVP